jgi:hypothetical protein
MVFEAKISKAPEPCAPPIRRSVFRFKDESTRPLPTLQKIEIPEATKAAEAPKPDEKSLTRTPKRRLPTMDIFKDIVPPEETVEKTWGKKNVCEKTLLGKEFFIESDEDELMSEAEDLDEFNFKAKGPSTDEDNEIAAFLTRDKRPAIVKEV